MFVFYGPLSGSYELEAANAVIAGEEIGGKFGYDVDITPDVNGDGIDDVLVGAPGLKEGKAFLFYGSIETNIDVGDADASFTGVIDGDSFGSVVVGAGDLDGDSYGDLIITAPHADYFTTYDVGAVFLFYGPLEGEHKLSDLEYKCSGNQFIGDVTGDDIIDMRDLFVLTKVIGLEIPMCFDISQLLGMEGFGLEGTYDLGGEPICCGDVNGDGVIDFLDWIALKNYVYGFSHGFPRGYSCSIKENCFDSWDNDLDGSTDFEDSDCPLADSIPSLPAPYYKLFYGDPSLPVSSSLTGFSLSLIHI